MSAAVSMASKSGLLTAKTSTEMSSQEVFEWKRRFVCPPTGRGNHCVHNTTSWLRHFENECNGYAYY